MEMEIPNVLLIVLSTILQLPGDTSSVFYSVKMNLVKIPFFLINLIFLILSLGVLALGIFLLTDIPLIDRIISFSNLSEVLQISEKAHREEIIRNNHSSTHESDNLHPLAFTDPISYILIGVGGLIFVLSFVGYCGAIKDSRILIGLFGALLTLILILEVIGLSFYFHHKPDVKSFLSQSLKNHYNPEPDLYPPTQGTKFTIIMDYVMMENGCCGINGDSDFHEIYDKHHKFADDGRLPMQRIPETCCRLNNNTNYKEINDIYESILLRQSAGSGGDHLNLNEKGPPRTRRELLQFAVDQNTCLSGNDGTSAYLGEENGCFDKVQTDWGTLLLISGIIIGILQIGGVIFSIFVFKAAYYDFHG